LLLRLLPGTDQELDAMAPVDGAVTVRNPCLSGGWIEIFLDPCLPAPTMVVVGDSPVAEALADIARRLGFDVASFSGSPVETSPDDAALVVASHGRDEAAALVDGLTQRIPYVGLVASAVRGTAVRDALDVPHELRARLRSPAGLEIGAQTPAEIALAIVAEIVAERRGSPLGRPWTEAPAPAEIRVAIDPVCGMEVAVSEMSIHFDVDGERRYFCSEGCRDAFAAELHDRASR
jgi:xanthine dehydrogenase accessory factor